MSFRQLISSHWERDQQGIALIEELVFSSPMNRLHYVPINSLVQKMDWTSFLVHRPSPPGDIFWDGSDCFPGEGFRKYIFYLKAKEGKGLFYYNSLAELQERVAGRAGQKLKKAFYKAVENRYVMSPCSWSSLTKIDASSVIVAIALVALKREPSLGIGKTS